MTTGSRERLLAIAWVLGVAAVALLPDPGAAIPSATYYFRDFTQTFYPLRHSQAAELAAGRLPFWNPYVHEGEFMLPSFYPPDLLHVLDRSPQFISWLLTLHLPLAALAAYWLAREIGASSAGAFAAGAVYALSGFTLSSLNLYLFLQALTLAPFVAGLLRRAALEGGRSIVFAAGAVQLIRPRQGQEQAESTASFDEVLVRGVPVPRYRDLRMGLPAKAELLALWKKRATAACGAGGDGGPAGLVRHFGGETTAPAGDFRFSYKFPYLQQILRRSPDGTRHRHLSALAAQSRALHACADRGDAPRIGRHGIQEPPGAVARGGYATVPAVALEQAAAPVVGRRRAASGGAVRRAHRAGEEPGVEGYLLAVTPEAHGPTPHGEYYLHGGHRLWTAPEDPFYTCPEDGVTVTRETNRVTLRSGVDPSGLEKEISFRLDGSRVALAHRVTWHGREPIELAPWAITQVRLGGMAILPQSSLETGLLPNRNLVLWPYSHLRDERLSLY